MIYIIIIVVLIFIIGWLIGYNWLIIEYNELTTEVIKLELQNKILIRDKRGVDRVLKSIKNEDVRVDWNQKDVIVLYEPKPDFDFGELFSSRLEGIHNDND